MRGPWTGEGPAVVLLHGQPGSAADWELVLPHLGGLRLLVPDRPGYDGTPAGGFAHNAAALFRRLDDAGIERAVLVGHSWGGGVALRAALDAPRRIAALCLLGSVGSSLAVSRTDRLLAIRGVGSGSARFMARTGRRMAPVVAATSGSRLDAPQRATLAATLGMWSLTGAWGAFAAEQRALVQEGPGIARRLREVQAPAVVTMGGRDAVVPPEAQRDLATRLPRAELRHLDGGHLLTLEAPAQVAAAVRRAVELGA